MTECKTHKKGKRKEQLDERNNSGHTLCAEKINANTLVLESQFGVFKRQLKICLTACGNECDL